MCSRNVVMSQRALIPLPGFAHTFNQVLVIPSKSSLLWSSFKHMLFLAGGCKQRVNYFVFWRSREFSFDNESREAASLESWEKSKDVKKPFKLFISIKSG